MNLVKFISSSIDSLARRVVKFKRLGNSDVQTSIQAGPYGIDSVPVKDLIAVYGKTDIQGDTVVIGYLNKNALADTGEMRIFSTNSDGQLQTYVWLKANGDIHLGGNAGNAVRYQELKSGFDTLKDDFNNFLTLYNAHTHAGVTSGLSVTGPTASLGTPTTADIAQSKINSIKTP